MDLLTQIWQNVGTPLTVMFWVYIVFMAIAAIGSFGVIFIVLRMFWKDRKKFGGWN